ncbi:hypothetical protein ACFS07_13470 [Undibacterium arcticum]
MIMWRYRIYSAIDPIGTILAVLLINWWAPLFASQDGWLPNWLAWVQTFDASLDAGGAQGSYWGRVAWLNRNPAYGFSYWALGVPFNPSEWRVTAFFRLGSDPRSVLLCTRSERAIQRALHAQRLACQAGV